MGVVCCQKKNAPPMPDVGIPVEEMNTHPVSDVFKSARSSAYMPVLPDVHKTSQLRFILIGNIVKNGEVTDERTGAYIDLTLKP